MTILKEYDKKNNKLNCKASYLIKIEIILENILLKILRIKFLNSK